MGVPPSKYWGMYSRNASQASCWLSQCSFQLGRHAHAVVAVAAMPLEFHARYVAEPLLEGLLELVLAVDA
jgi:hypothetical protein